MRNCCECWCPVERGVEVQVIGGPKISVLCNCCAEMLLAALRSGHLVKCQSDWIDEIEYMKKLRSGADYI